MFAIRVFCGSLPVGSSRLCAALFGLCCALFAIVLLNVFAALWAAVKTDEKNPPDEPGEPCTFGVRAPGVFISSMVGVKGAMIEFERRLGTWVAESDLALLWMLAFGVVNDPVPLLGEPLVGDVLSLLCSNVGVGGVTVVRGVSSPALGGVLRPESIFGRVALLESADPFPYTCVI